MLKTFKSSSKINLAVVSGIFLLFYSVQGLGSGPDSILISRHCSYTVLALPISNDPAITINGGAPVATIVAKGSQIRTPAPANASLTVLNNHYQNQMAAAFYKARDAAKSCIISLIKNGVNCAIAIPNDNTGATIQATSYSNLESKMKETAEWDCARKRARKIEPTDRVHYKFKVFRDHFVNNSQYSNEAFPQTDRAPCGMFPEPKEQMPEVGSTLANYDCVAHTWGLPVPKKLVPLLSPIVIELPKALPKK